MSKFAVVATYDIAPELIDSFLPFLFAHRDRCLATEPGTLRFDVLRAGTTLMLYEVYADEAAFEAHRNGASVAQMRHDAAAVKRDLSFIKCELLD